MQKKRVQVFSDENIINPPQCHHVVQSQGKHSLVSDPCEKSAIFVMLFEKNVHIRRNCFKSAYTRSVRIAHTRECSKDATSAIANVDDYSGSAKLLAATTLRNVLGTRNLGDILSERESIATEMESVLDEATDPWGNIYSIFLFHKSLNY